MSDQAQEGAVQRPGAATAFGILSIIFASIALLVQVIIGGIGALVGSFAGDIAAAAAADADLQAVGDAFSSAMGATAQQLLISTIVFAIAALAVAVFQLAGGIGLLKGSAKSLGTNKLYAFSAIGVAVAQIVVNIVLGAPILWFWTIIGLAYPILIIALVVNNQTIKDWIAKKGA